MKLYDAEVVFWVLKMTPGIWRIRLRVDKKHGGCQAPGLWVRTFCMQPLFSVATNVAIDISTSTLPETNSLYLNIDVWNTFSGFLFGDSPCFPVLIMLVWGYPYLSIWACLNHSPTEKIPNIKNMFMLQNHLLGQDYTSQCVLTWYFG